MLRKLLVLLLLVPRIAAAQTERDAQAAAVVHQLYLDDIAAGVGGAPIVELYVRVLSRYWEPVEGLTAADFDVRDADRLVPSAELELQRLEDTTRGVACVIAIDRSRTMRGAPFESALAAAKTMLGRLGEHDRAAVVVFSDDVEVVAPFAASRAESEVRLASLSVDEESMNTVVFDGIHKSVELVRAAVGLPRRAFVIVFSDGQDSGSLNDLDGVITLGQGGELEPPTLIFAIGYAAYGEAGLDGLRRLAADTGGDFLRAESASHLKAFFSATWRQMKRSYVLRYQGELDGTQHEVAIDLGGQVARRKSHYPDMSSAILPSLRVSGLAAAVLVALAAIGCALFFWRRRSTTALARLVFESGPLAGDVVPLGKKMTVGATQQNDIVISTHTISRFHAEIRVGPESAQIEDTGSSNGTFVNGHKVALRALESGDRVRFADVEAVFER